MPSPSLLPAGYLSTSGSQFVDQYGNYARIASVGWQAGDSPNNPMNGSDGTYASILANAQQIVSFGFNCARISWNNLYYTNAYCVQQYQFAVQACGAVGLKIVFDHHSDEGNTPQQQNGLWFDSGAGTDGTNGEGRTGTVTASKFQSDWVAFAKRWVGNDTVIGYDLHNEPTTGNASQLTKINWAGHNWDGTTTTAGNECDIRNMYQTVGNAILAVDPNKLIICEGVMNYSRSFATGSYAAYEGDFTLVTSLPVVLSSPNKLVYSVHIYPNYVSGVSPDSGSTVWSRWMNTWAFIVSQGIAPVWIGEMGASLDGSETLYGGSISASTTWANSVVAFINGSTGNLSYSGNQQPISTDWWCWADNGNQQLSGVVGDDNNARPGQYAAYSQLQYFPKTGTTSPTPPPVFIESPQGTSVTTTAASIIDSIGEVFTITTGAQIAVNGIVDTTTANVIQLYYSAHAIWQLNKAGNWYSKATAGAAWVQTTSPLTTSQTPTTPSPTPSGAPRVSAPLTNVSLGTWVSGDLDNAAYTSATGAKFHYNYLLPSGYNSNVVYPILVWEHTTQVGPARDWYAGYGDPLGLVYDDPVNGADPDHYFNNAWFRTAYPCIVVVPYCYQTYGTDAGNDAVENFGGWTPPGDHGPNEDAVAALAQYFLTNYSTDPTRVYVTGESLGGIGSWALALDYNQINGSFGKIFTAFAPYAGVIERFNGSGPNQTILNQIQNVPIFAVHGANDGTSQPFWNYNTWQGLAGNSNYPQYGSNSPSSYQAGTSAFHLIVDPGLGHDVWNTYRVQPYCTPVYDWMFAQVSGSNVTTPTPTTPTPTPVTPTPPVTPTTPTPTGTESPNGTSVSSARTGTITDALGNLWKMFGSGDTGNLPPFFVGKNGVRDASTYGTLQMYYSNHTVYYQITSGWFSYTGSVWVIASDPTATIPTTPTTPTTNPFINFGAPINATWEVVTGLLENTSYDFEVEAINAYGQSQWSNLITVITGSNSAGRGLATNLMTVSGKMTNINSTASAPSINFGSFKSVSALGNALAGNSGSALASGMVFAAASTAYQGVVSNIHVGLSPWAAGTYAVGARVSASGSAWQCTQGGLTGESPPNGVTAAYPDGLVIWRWLSRIDFASLQAWGSSSTAIPATPTMPSVGLIWNNGTINATNGTAILSLSGHSTSSTNTITLKCAAGESIRDAVAGGQPLAFSATKGVSITLPNATGNVNYIDIADANVFIDGIQVKDINTAGTSNCTHVATETANLTITNSIFDGYAQAGGASLIGSNSSSAAITLENCVLVDRQSPTSGGVAIDCNANGSAIIGCSIISVNGSSGAGVQSAATSFRVTNSIFTGYSDALDGTGNIQVDHCLFSASVASSTGGAVTLGSGNLYSRTAANQFINSASDFRLKTGADAIDTGTTAGLTTDFAYRVRPRGAAYDIGAYEA